MAQRRSDGLCFNCPEKFTPGHIHHCSMKGIYLLELDDSAPVDAAASDDEIEISLNAITGIKTGDTMHLAASVAGTSMKALVDSGSTHSFIAETSARLLGAAIVPRPGLSVGVANGDRMPCSGILPTTPVTIGTERFVIDLYVLPLGDYELVLGCQWLKSLGPILWDFDRHSMAFWRNGHHVRWAGTESSPSPRLRTMQHQDLLSLLLAEFSDIFTAPTELPPPRRLDHRIHLLPNTAPVAVQP